MTNIIFFDVETIYNEDNKQDLDSCIEKYGDRCDFMPELNKILCICVWYIQPDWMYKIKNLEWNEEEQIRKFFELSEKYNLCGFNILNFDLPFIIKRALSLWIKIPNSLKIYWKKPREITNVIDLKDIYKYWVFWWIWDLDIVTKSLWVVSPKEQWMSWKDVQKYYDDRKEDEIIKYCCRDVQAVIDLYNKFLILNLI